MIYFGYCGKCKAQLVPEPVYEQDDTVNVSCGFRCGKNWELPVNDTGPRGILGRALKRQQMNAINGV